MISPHELSQLWRDHASSLLLLAKSRCGTAIDQAEDCVQEAFIRLASQVPVPEDCLAWLVRVVRNAAIDASRSHKRRVAREQSTAMVRKEFFDSEATNTSLTTDDVVQALNTLDSETREIVIAHIWNNLTFRQIADVFEISAATTHRRYLDGLNQLRQAMNQIGELTGSKEEKS